MPKNLEFLQNLKTFSSLRSIIFYKITLFFKVNGLIKYNARRGLKRGQSPRGWDSPPKSGIPTGDYF